MRWTVIICLLTLCLHACDSTSDDKKQVIDTTSPVSLELLSPEATGIQFNNTLQDQGRINVFVWNFLYSGAGVAVGDINNDGLPDIYFAANQNPDRIYLNKGNFQFEDITQSAGIADRQWSTGVTMADVNADGFMDIYVCKNSAVPNPDANRNKLYINRGNNTFQERSAEYGLDDTGFSIQASFYDIDNDGDLDMYLVNQPFDEFAQYVHPKEQVDAYPYSDRIFLNDGSTFVDNTDRAGLVNRRYGLNVSIADFDRNGWTDMYVSNDYHHADHLYMNDRGKMTDEIIDRTGHISFYSMGTDVADINNDGWSDAVVLDMAFSDHYRSKTNMESMQPERFWQLVADGQHHQYAQNSLQLNTGNGHFIEVAQVSGLSKTDWSWAPLLADLDHDGLKDALVTNGIMKDMKNNDFTEYVKRRYQGQVGPQNFQDVLTQLPSTPVANHLYHNSGDLMFADISSQSGFDAVGFSHGMAVADLNNDGKLDVIVNNMNAPASIYRNTSEVENSITLVLDGPKDNRNGLGCSVDVHWQGQLATGTMQTTRGYLSASPAELHFGIGNASKVDSLVVRWNHYEQTVVRDIAPNQLLSVGYNNSHENITRPTPSKGLNYAAADVLAHRHTEVPYDDYAKQVLLPYKLSQNGPFVSQGDINADGYMDLFIGGAAGQSGALYLQNSSGIFEQTNPSAFSEDLPFEDMESAFIDCDLDGDLDLYISSGSNEFEPGDPALADRIYRNDGNGELVRQLVPGAAINGQSVLPLDDRIFLGGRLVGGQYLISEKSQILDQPQLNDLSNAIAPFLSDIGMVTDAVAADVDGDGDQDILVLGEWMSPQILINSNGTYSRQPVAENLTGIWWTVETTDINNDGRPDFILGNLGWNNKFGGAEANLQLHAGDIDGNGDHDVVLAKTKDGKTLPVRGRECSSEEMPFVLNEFPTFDAFAKAELGDILDKGSSDGTVYGEIETFSSMSLLNNGDGTFTAIDLPVLCQTGPIKAIACKDLNLDGNMDFIYAGNHYPTEVETARYDGLRTGIALGYGDGSFDCYPMEVGGRPLTGDFRDIALVPTENGTIAVFTRNDDSTITILIDEQEDIQ